METIFTKIVKGEIPCYKIAENDDYFAFLDIRPTSKGHTLVIPKIQNDYIFDLSDEQLCGLVLFAKKIAKALIKAIPCERIGIKVIGLEVPHTHIHLIPIRVEGDMNHGKEILKFTDEEYKDIAKTIIENISD
ncbi:MAG: HIT family protein [Bacteroidetes bacterium]|nr:HIT family protein [Bacteroidota bacterium]MCL1968267.1 HIT family protein [Bacteroidota bacterium]